MIKTGRHRILLALLVLLVGCRIQSASADDAIAATQSQAIVPPDKNDLHIYLLMGQSNMIGRDTSGLKSQVDNKQVLAFNADGKWVIARDPIHRQGRIAGGVGPGIPFALEMLKADSKATIGLVPCAVGGTALSRWIKGGDLYEKALSQAKLAAQSGVISGMLWHQGEADSANEERAQTYQSRLAKVFKDLREDLGTPDLPIVVGQLGEFLPTEKHPYVKTVHSALEHMPDVIPHTGYADSKGLEDKGDQLHFNAAGAIELGKRYAKAMQALTVQPMQPVRHASRPMP